MKFDFVIVGGGSAGAVLAARLSENPAVNVCLIEAGGAGKNLLVRLPAAVVAVLPGYGKLNNWAFETTPQPGLGGRRGYQPRGRGLGGSSAINAMLYIRGQREDYNEWGLPGWDWNSLLPYFIRSQNNEGGDSELHGSEGPLHVSAQRNPRPMSRAFVEAGKAFGLPERDDFNTGDNEGVGLYRVTQFHSEARRGERCSAAAAYLHPVMSRPNLTVLTKTRALKILFEGKTARGVRCRKGHRDFEVEAAREVILCGGAFGSPQLLQLSGIGRPEDFRPHGIETVHELPGVGQNLQDHLDFTIAWKSPETDSFGIGFRGALNLMRHAWAWRKNGSGMLATPFAEGAAFLRSSSDVSRPDLQLHFVIGIVDDHARKLHAGYGWSCHVCVLRPWSRGRVGLASANPMADPLIDPSYLSDPRDLELLRVGAKHMRSLLMQAPLAPYRARELHGIGGNLTDAQWDAQIRRRADTIYHPVGTCRMGTDALAVTDLELRVHGLQRLRVVDASVMPRLISGNTNAPVIAMTERAADLIRADLQSGW